LIVKQGELLAEEAKKGKTRRERKQVVNLDVLFRLPFDRVGKTYQGKDESNLSLQRNLLPLHACEATFGSRDELVDLGLDLLA
jgi:hypothetical protein